MRRLDAPGRMAGMALWGVMICFSGSAAAAGSGPQTAPKRITVALMPLWSEGPVGRELGFGIIVLAGAELLDTGDFNHVHLKQVLRLAREHDWRLSELGQAARAEQAAALLGAQTGLWGTLRPVGSDGFRLEVTAFDLRSGKRRSTSVKLPSDRAQAVRQGAGAVAALVAGFDAVSLSADAHPQPQTGSGQAMEAYLACAAVLLEQPMGLRESHVVDPERLAGARRKCERAVELDPGFVAAWAALSLAESLAMRSEQAARALEPTRRKGIGYLPIGTLAHYWLATRFQSNADGARVLRQAAADHPGALLFLSYLGEHLQVTGQFDQAVVVWDRLLELVPGNPFAMARKGHALARLGRLDEAIALSRRACELDPESLELKLELASRLVDAARLDDAERLLVPMVADPKANGEILLRLGYVYLLQKRDDLAERWLNQALAKAVGPNEWRTRGRARYDLAIVMARRDRLADAEQHLLAAAAEGFLVRSLLQDNQDLRVLAARPGCAHLFKNPKLKADPLLHASPFPVDLAGEVDPNAKRTGITGFTF